MRADKEIGLLLLTFSKPSLGVSAQLSCCKARKCSLRHKLNPLSRAMCLYAILCQLLFLDLIGNKRASKHV